ncbi:MAG: 30S ribosome-binding factor RbfA [Ancrocorticia sp.]|jgi:ribosome-binding factor A|nr:30S ribosome-binding factor RbfA [Ancrocorticia sp.]MCI1963378.1 30S ribosome-binding factor RbfA [Ancrocorticia sp.]MCI2002428.1 30S ribosome-binding factor RbfA [Ancrocorticia sp.]MCI2012144.1 30S ribosome-binding factor RbfA [Ancrocorticia sp.]MCI2028777.1 30S ribosome-binding factor RbfA [Ancrocorticia sp.]
MANPRERRVAERIREVVASLVTSRLKDPGLDMVTITDVRVTGDLQHATIFYTVYGTPSQLRNAGRALERAKGLIRSHVGKVLGLRLTPSVEFVADALPESAKTFEDALTAARFRDEQIAKRAQEARFAGEPTPYKSANAEDSSAETDNAAE